MHYRTNAFFADVTEKKLGSNKKDIHEGKMSVKSNSCQDISHKTTNVNLMAWEEKSAGLYQSLGDLSVSTRLSGPNFMASSCYLLRYISACNTIGDWTYHRATLLIWVERRQCCPNLIDRCWASVLTACVINVMSKKGFIWQYFPGVALYIRTTFCVFS